MKLATTLITLPLVLAACGGIPVATVTVTQQPPVTVTAPAPEPQPETQRSAPRDPALLMRLLKSTDPVFGYLDTADVVEVAVNICDRLDNGYSAAEILSIAVDAGLTKDQAAAVVAASIVVYCPWNETSSGN